MTPLATGGMARIYIARTTGIGSFERHVVLKLITPERANDHTAVQMFLDEARLAASLNHQNVAQVFEVGEDAGIHYLAMEYVHGQDLRALLAKAGSQGTRVPLELALTVVAGAASGLNHAHERRDSNGVPLGIVHRDVSPSNIMIGLDGSVKLLDFGIAKATARSIETVSGIIKGKFAYMAPEQCRGREVDKRSDVFSLGIILYEITTQHRCFRADSDFDTMHRIVTGDVVRPTRLVQGYPQALEAIVMKALAVDANQRYQSAHQLLEAIESFSVAARMSLSTMSLGRFMRDMFGETPEPWLAPNRGQTLPPQKESTISNTNASNEAPARPTTSTTSTTSTEEPEQPANHTLLDMHRGDQQEADDSNAAEWNAKSYPTAQPSYASSQTLPPDNAKPGRVSSSQLKAVTPAPISAQVAVPVAIPKSASQPSVQAPAFPSKPGSGSGPAHPAMPSTRQGYANAPGTSHNDLGYPKYEPDADDSLADDDLRLKPNRRPLFIGIGIVIVGLAIILAVTIGGKSDNVAPVDDKASDTVKDQKPATNDNHEVTPEGSAQNTQVKPPIPDEPKPKPDQPPPQPPTDESIKIHVVSDPPGADVLLAGKPIGTTPLDTQQKRGTSSASLVIHHAGYEDLAMKIDLTTDFDQDVTLTKLPDNKRPPTVDKKPPVVDKKPPVVDKRPPVVDKKPPVVDKKPPVGPGSGSATVVTPPVKKLPPCQPPTQIDPFDPRPICGR